MHVALLALSGAALTVLVVCLLRFLQNTLLNGKRPPIYEDIPFVGGLLKFIKVGRVPAREQIGFGGREWKARSGHIADTSFILQGPWGLLTDGYARYGEVFTVPVAHKRITFLIGPDVSPHFFKASDDEMSQTEVRGRHGRDRKLRHMSTLI